MRITVLAVAVGVAVLFGLMALLSPVASAGSGLPGAVFTTLEDGTRVNANIYESKLDVYLDGGPGPNAPQTAAGLPDGNYYFQVTDPSGKSLLSEDPPICREFRVEDGVIAEYVSMGRSYVKNGNNGKTVPCWMDGKENGRHDTGYDVDHGAVTIQLMPYKDTRNKGGVYKAWATPTAQFVGDPNSLDNRCGTGCFHGFLPAFSKTDNFKVKERGPPFANPILTVRKFVDTDGDGVWDAGEPEVGVDVLVDGGGWPVSVADPNEVTSNGFTPYAYLPGFAGPYIVTEDLLSGWSQTAAIVDGVAVTVSTSVTVDIAFTSGETHEVVFGNFECFDVSGQKIDDLDGDGVRDAGEPGIAGWSIELYRNGQSHASTTTGADGSYSFTVCQGGNYEVREETRSDWTPTSPTSVSFTAASGVDVTSVDFLNFRHFLITGYKVEDIDGDGVWDAGEPGLAGWTIELYRNGQWYASTTTGAGGFYTFTVTEGGSYEVREVLQADWIATNPASGSHFFTATSGTDRSFDFLNFKLGQICGAKFYDANHNGAWDDGEPTIPNWRVELYLGVELVATATTDADGRYCFTGLMAGVYEVREVMPLDPDDTHVWAQTFPGGDGVWSITVTSGLDEQNADFGNVCEFIESRTWGYWKTHTGFDSPPRDEAYDLLPDNPLEIDLTTPDGDNLVETDAEAKWLFDGAGGGPPNCSGTCRSLFRAQLLALHMNLLKFPGMGDQVYVGDDGFAGMTVQEIHDAMVAALLTAGSEFDFTAYQETLDRINNNHNEPTGSHVLVCPEPPEPQYP